MTESEKTALVEWLSNEVKLIESTRDEIPFGLDHDGEMALKGIHIALASLTAEPEDWQFKSCNGGWLTIGEHGMLEAEAEGYEVRPLYTAPPAPAVPHGWKLVPIEATQAMIDAHTEGMISGGAAKAYRQMLAAAPEETC